MDILEKIVAVKAGEVEQMKAAVPLSALQEKVQGRLPGRNFREAVESRRCAIISEVKKHSPSRGSLREDIDPCEVAVLYEKNGASAISVLTDREFFHGLPEYLVTIKNAVHIPVLRKDFIIDIYQIYESKLMGADAVLLIAGLLMENLRQYIEITRSLGMWPLVEVHTPVDLQIAVAAGAEIIGINNRNLKTFGTDIRTTVDMAPLVPKDKTLISESGINTRQDIETLMRAGVHVFLIGEALMRASDPGLMLRELCGGRDL